MHQQRGRQIIMKEFPRRRLILDILVRNTDRRTGELIAPLRDQGLITRELSARGSEKATGDGAINVRSNRLGHHSAAANPPISVHAYRISANPRSLREISLRHCLVMWVRTAERYSAVLGRGAQLVSLDPRVIFTFSAFDRGRPMFAAATFYAPGCE